MAEDQQEPGWEQAEVEVTQEHWCLEEELAGANGRREEEGMPEAITQEPKKENNELEYINAIKVSCIAHLYECTLNAYICKIVDIIHVNVYIVSCILI